jgi:hypothetical protein
MIGWVATEAERRLGTLSDLGSCGGESKWTDVGDDASVLLARVRFGSISDEQMPVVPEDCFIGPYDMQMASANAQSQLFSYFAEAFAQVAGPSQPPYTCWADFDRSGRLISAIWRSSRPISIRLARRCNRAPRHWSSRRTSRTLSALERAVAERAVAPRASGRCGGKGRRATNRRSSLFSQPSRSGRPCRSSSHCRFPGWRTVEPPRCPARLRDSSSRRSSMRPTATRCRCLRIGRNAGRSAGNRWRMCSRPWPNPRPPTCWTAAPNRATHCSLGWAGE